ncbi:MAG: hypothetical protein ACYDA9_17675 [Terriglobia bacterium]
MLRILKQRTEIAVAQAVFEKHFEDAGERRTIKAGHPGETHELDGFWIASEGIWVGFRVLRNRYWNAFGLGLQASNSIICEINIPIEGENVQIAGVFAQEENNLTWVLHRGRIGGGKKGVSKALFEKHYNGRWLNAEGDPFAVVANLSQPDFVKCVADFVKLVDGIKRSV